jgi:hypothetical protein
LLPAPQAKWWHTKCLLHKLVLPKQYPRTILTTMTYMILETITLTLLLHLLI